MIIDELFESPQQCPECGGISFSDLILAEKKDACYHKVKASAKVWPSAYASGRLVQCRKKGAANYGNSKNESMAEGEVVPFKRPHPQTSVSWQNLPKDVLTLANDWFWADYEGGGFDATMDPKGLGSGFANQQKYLGAQLQQRGWAIDIDDEFENVVLKNKQGQTILLPIEDAQTFSGWSKGTNPVTEQGVAEANIRRDPLDLPPLEGPGSGAGMGGGMGGGGGGGMSRNIATQRSVGGKEIPSLGQASKVVTSPTADRVLTKLGGKNASTTTGPAVTVQKRGSEYEPLAVDVPAYVRKGLPDPVTTPVGKPKITVRPGETQSQAMQRTKAEQEFNKFLRGQGGQSFGTPGAGRGGQGGPNAAQATSGSNQIPTIKLPGGQTIPDPARLSPSGQYNTQSGSSQASGNVGDKEAYNAALKIRKNQWNQMKTGKEKEGEKRRSAWKTPETDVELEEASRKKREQPEVNYDDEYDAMVARVKKLAGLGPMKTVYDPNKRVYRNMPTAQQPKK